MTISLQREESEMREARRSGTPFTASSNGSSQTTSLGSSTASSRHVLESAREIDRGSTPERDSHALIVSTRAFILDSFGTTI
jgi:hypothetical protein